MSFRFLSRKRPWRESALIREEDESPPLQYDRWDAYHDEEDVLLGVFDDESSDIEAHVEVASPTSTGSGRADSPELRTSTIIQIVAVLAVGLFASNLDNFLVIATHPRIASEFNALEDSSWIFVSFLLAGAATQVLYAKLSDVYGRMYVLVFCYGLFAVGCAIIGLSTSLWHVVLGRILSGSGGAGMASLVLVLTTDIIPLRDVASWLGYMNVVSTTGRSLGGPLGGFLADQVGWRWSFLGQVPFFVVAIIASLFVIPNTKATVPTSDEIKNKNKKSILSRLDLAGSILLGVAILLIMLPFEIGGQKIPWTHPAIYGLFAAGFLTLGLFAVNEAQWAEEPAIPLRLLGNRDVVASYLVICCIAAAQTAALYFVPIYFQVTAGVSNTVAGLHLVPSVVGNTVGGLVAGSLIKRTGRYKTLALASSLCASVGFLLLVLRWSGHTNWWESLYLIPCGFANGMGWSAIIVSINTVAEPAHRAVLVSGLQLVTPVAMLLGVAATSAVMFGVLQKTLSLKLMQIGLGEEMRNDIIQNVTANVECIQELPANIAEHVVGGYVVALRASFGVILGISMMGIVAGMFLRQRSLAGQV